MMAYKHRTLIAISLFFLILASLQGVCIEKANVDLRNKRIMVLGDSITQAHSWVSILDYHLQKTYSTDTVDIVGVGLSSETASGLSEADHPFPRPCVHERLGRLLGELHPDVVIACYGMNDGIYHPPSGERMKAYQDGMKKLIQRCRTAGVSQFILMTPPPFTPKSGTGKAHSTDADEAVSYSYMKPYRAYDDVLVGYGKWLLSLDNGTDILVADTHGPMAAYQSQKRTIDPDFSLSKDGIHPGFTGHLLMANAVLERIGLCLEPKDPACQEKSIKEDPLFELVDKRSRLLGDAWRKCAGFIRNKAQTMTKVDNIDDKLLQASELQIQIDGMR